MKEDIEDIKILLSLIINGRLRGLSSAEQLVFKATIERLGIVVHPKL